MKHCFTNFINIILVTEFLEEWIAKVFFYGLRLMGLMVASVVLLFQTEADGKGRKEQYEKEGGIWGDADVAFVKHAWCGV